MKHINDETKFACVKQKRVQRACKHLTLFLPLKCLMRNERCSVPCVSVCVCVRPCVRACQDDKKMRGDRHNSCIMIVTSEPLMIYLCILFATVFEMFLLTEGIVSLGGGGGPRDGCMDGSKKKIRKSNK